MPQQLTRMVKDEFQVDVHVRISGKTLWIYVPLDDLIETEAGGWNKEGLEKINKVINATHRVILSTDAPIDFVAVLGADIKSYGVELLALEYVPDLKQAMMEKFSRGEYFMRSVRDVRFDPTVIGDLTGETRRYRDVTFDVFVCMQIMHRAKTLFAKDKLLSNLFELKTTAWTQKFGILKLEFEFLRKRYDLSPEEENIKPLDTVKMIAAEVIRNYGYKDIQGVELTDTFSEESVKLNLEELEQLEIDLPEYRD
ncbi:MAG: hypothetical protein PHH75_05195 [Candidatus Omnitrophica bacterium]|nr:hypothetical protein [Candidatus Omnitrophota bacterium]MDD5574559.1 hypothetical protein [Candidatus Omnitrophota bacterium]